MSEDQDETSPRRSNEGPARPPAQKNGIRSPVPDFDDGRDRPIIQREQEWRKPPPALVLPNGRCARISISRWSGEVGAKPIEVCTDIISDCHMISRTMRRTDLYLSIGRKALANGSLMPGHTLLTGPDLQKSQAVYRQDFEVVRVFVPQSLLIECLENISGRDASLGIALFEHHERDDKIIHHLITSLVSVGEDGGPLGSIFLDSVGMTLTTHLISRYFGGTRAVVSRRLSPLARWRLKRVVDYVEAQLAQELSLGDLSAVAGLSRMHFAGQFKMATGVSAHTYVLHRRIAASKRLLVDSNLSIEDVAITVGFKAQAHFISVFRRIVGESPGRWRQTVR